jgi:uncharacterized phage protein (TIGR01671 family)
MRDIKFRAHIKGTKIVGEVKEIDFVFGKILMTFIADDNTSRTCRYDSHEINLLKFTTLKDKNGKGKEIYEGDIIQTQEIRWVVKFGYHRDGIGLGWIAWTGKSGNGHFIDKSILAGSVIGNIYEHPELINP